MGNIDTIETVVVTRKTILKVLKWIGIFVVLFLIIGTIVRIPHVLEVNKTAEQVAKIHATKLTLADVMGEHLPPDPGIEGDKTIPGIDANTNGIRDDVELAIFKEYPDSLKIRAALLQYALALQMQFVQPLQTEGVVVAVAQERSRASVCIGGVTSRDNIAYFIKKTQEYTDFVRMKQINTTQRDESEEVFLSKLGSYSDLEVDACDIDFKDANEIN